MKEITINRLFNIDSFDLRQSIKHIEQFFNSNKYAGVTVSVCDWTLILHSTNIGIPKKLIVVEFNNDAEFTMFSLRFHNRIACQHGCVYIDWKQHNVAFGFEEVK